MFSGADAVCDLYDDAGDGYDYGQDNSAVIRLEWSEQSKTLTIGEPEGAYADHVAARQFHTTIIG